MKKITLIFCSLLVFAMTSCELENIEENTTTFELDKSGNNQLSVDIDN